MQHTVNGVCLYDRGLHLPKRVYESYIQIRSKFTPSTSWSRYANSISFLAIFLQHILFTCGHSRKKYWSPELYESCEEMMSNFSFLPIKPKYIANFDYFDSLFLHGASSSELQLLFDEYPYVKRICCKIGDRFLPCISSGAAIKFDHVFELFSPDYKVLQTRAELWNNWWSS